MSFRSHSENHAVEVTSFRLVFAVPAKNTAMKPSDLSEVSHIRKMLPAFHEVQHVSVHFSEHVETTHHTNGARFALFEPNGKHAWSLEITPESIEIECRVYSRWKYVSENAFKIMFEALDILASKSDGNGPKLGNISLSVTDRFVPENDEFDASGLLKPSAFIPAFLFKAGPAFHSHNGWFAVEDQFKTLHNLNVSSQPKPDASDQNWQIRILHLQQLSDVAGAALQSDQITLSQHFNLMHERNKLMIQNVLQNSVLSEIGMGQDA